MEYKSFIILLLTSVFLTGSCHAGPAEVKAQQAEWDRLGAAEDSLVALRSRLAGDVKRLAARIDSLKTGATRASGALQDSLRRSVVLVDRVEGVDRALEGVRGDLTILGERLREAYDREIGVLIGLLGKAPDQALIRRLTAYQQAREALGRERAAPRAPVRAGVDALTIREEDGPGEIRQKADLMEDMAARLNAEVKETERRLSRLEEERRLRARVTVFARELTLFDENLPEGRTIAAGGRSVAAPSGEADAKTGGAEDALTGAGADAALDASRGSESAGGTFAPEGPLLGESAGGEAVAGREVSPGGAQGLPADLSVDDLALEIAQLKARRAGLQTRDRALKEQVAALRKRIQEMLEEWK